MRLKLYNVKTVVANCTITLLKGKIAATSLAV